MSTTNLRCAHCGSNAVTRTGRDSFRCEHCGTEGARIRSTRSREA